MEKTYFEQIEDIIKTHPEVHQAAVIDIIHRCRCWLEGEYTGEDDSYILNQLNYLKRWIE